MRKKRTHSLTAQEYQPDWPVQAIDHCYRSFSVSDYNSRMQTIKPLFSDYTWDNHHTDNALPWTLSKRYFFILEGYFTHSLDADLHTISITFTWTHTINSIFAFIPSFHCNSPYKHILHFYRYSCQTIVQTQAEHHQKACNVSPCVVANLDLLVLMAWQKMRVLLIARRFRGKRSAWPAGTDDLLQVTCKRCPRPEFVMTEPAWKWHNFYSWEQKLYL